MCKRLGIRLGIRFRFGRSICMCFRFGKRLGWRLGVVSRAARDL
jgi:hypothetical protein